MDIGIRIGYIFLDPDFDTQNFIKELRLKCDSTCDTGISQVKSRDAEVTSSSLLFDRREMVRQGEREERGMDRFGFYVFPPTHPLGSHLDFGY